MIEKVPPDLSKFLLCPMPGLLVQLHVGEGDKVEAGPAARGGRGDEDGEHPARRKGRHGQAGQRRAGDSLAVDAVILELE